MKNLLTVLFLCLSIVSFSQKVKIDSVAFIITHGELSFYLDKDTSSFISVQTINKNDINKLTGERSDKWHKESPYGPYKKDYYVHSGYDLGHLTPSNITSYVDSTNYNSFSLFNQAPQLAGFNRGKWAQIEAKVVEKIKASEKKAIVITGVIYDNIKPTYLGKSRIKIPISYYKILVIGKTKTCWIGSNINGEIIETDLKTILEVARKNKNQINITIK